MRLSVEVVRMSVRKTTAAGGPSSYSGGQELNTTPAQSAIDDGSRPVGSKHPESAVLESSFQALTPQTLKAWEGNKELKTVQMDHDYEYQNTESAVKRRQKAYLNKMSLDPRNCPYQFPRQNEYHETSEDETDNMNKMHRHLRWIAQPTFEYNEKDYQDDQGKYISGRDWLSRQPEAHEWQQIETVKYIANALELGKLSNILTKPENCTEELRSAVHAIMTYGRASENAASHHDRSSGNAASHQDRSSGNAATHQDRSSGNAASHHDRSSGNAGSHHDRSSGNSASPYPSSGNSVSPGRSSVKIDCDGQTPVNEESNGLCAVKTEPADRSSTGKRKRK